MSGRMPAMAAWAFLALTAAANAQQPQVLPAPRPSPEAAPAPTAGAVLPPLELNEVLASADTHFPLLLAVLQEQEITSGQLLAAQGAFDLNLRAREFWQVGTYDSHRITVGIDQQLAPNGVSYFAGYRHSAGNFPIYYGDRKTGHGGELRAGMLIPLLAGREIDIRRARVAQAEIARRQADPVIAAQRIDVIRAASRAYWTWVAAGRRYRIAHDVLRLAERRDRQLAELVRKGQVAEIERIDNQRVVVERQARLVATERMLQQAAIALSLYLRGPDGQPVLPASSRLPATLPEPAPWQAERLEKDLEVAMAWRPELARLRLQRERILVELDLARNQLLPGLNLGLEAYQDVGFGSAYSKTPSVKNTALDRSTYIASLQFDLPVQRRDARGRIWAGEGMLAQLFHQERFQVDRIRVEVQDASSALTQAYLVLQKAREGIQVARRVEAAETERFSRGQGTVVILNIRELTTAEASFAEVDAFAEYYRSLADLRAAVGVDGAAPAKAPLPGKPPLPIKVLPR